VDRWAGAGGKSEREKKHRDLTYCLPLSNDSVFKRPYGGGGGGCATRHLKINDERSNQTSIRPCPGQIFGGSIGAGLYFIFVSTHGRGLRRLAIATVVPIGLYVYIYIYMCTYAYLYVCMGHKKPLLAGGVTVFYNSVEVFTVAGHINV